MGGWIGLVGEVGRWGDEFEVVDGVEEFGVLKEIDVVKCRRCS